MITHDHSDKYQQIIHKLHDSNADSPYITNADFYNQHKNSPEGRETLKDHLYMGLVYNEFLKSSDKELSDRIRKLKAAVHDADAEEIGSLVDLISDVLDGED